MMIAPAVISAGSERAFRTNYVAPMQIVLHRRYATVCAKTPSSVGVTLNVIGCKSVRMDCASLSAALLLMTVAKDVYAWRERAWSRAERDE